MDAQQTGEHRFESLLRHFFKNLTQHLALAESLAGQTVRHPPLYDHKAVVKPFKNRWSIHYIGKVIHGTIRKVAHPCWSIRLVDNRQVDETTMKLWKYPTFFFQLIWYTYVYIKIILLFNHWGKSFKFTVSNPTRSHCQFDIENTVHMAILLWSRLIGWHSILFYLILPSRSRVRVLQKSHQFRQELVRVLPVEVAAVAISRTAAPLVLSGKRARGQKGVENTRQNLKKNPTKFRK